MNNSFINSTIILFLELQQNNISVVGINLCLEWIFLYSFIINLKIHKFLASVVVHHQQFFSPIFVFLIFIVNYGYL